jgi:hypothetical protein
MHAMLSNPRLLSKSAALIGVAAAAVIAFDGGEASAAPDVIRPGTRPGFFSGGVGPSFAAIGCGDGNCSNDIHITQFYGTLDFGWHLMDEGFEGPAIGANIHGGYGDVGFYGGGVGRFGAAFKFWWDIQPVDDIGIYATPFASAGWTSLIFDFRDYCVVFDPRFGCVEYGGRDHWVHFFNLQIGAMARLVLGDRGLVYFQPVTFDTLFNGDGVGLFYHFELGGGVIFP